MWSLFESCIIGSFSDEIDEVPQQDLFSTSLVITCKNKNTEYNTIKGIDNLDEATILSYYPSVTKNKYLEFEAKTGPNLVLTTLGRTVVSAKNKAYEEAKELDFKGIHYRKDICKASQSNIWYYLLSFVKQSW